jgi:hypothetical protein
MQGLLRRYIPIGALLFPVNSFVYHRSLYFFFIFLPIFINYDGLMNDRIVICKEVWELGLVSQSGFERGCKLKEEGGAFLTCHDLSRPRLHLLQDSFIVGIVSLVFFFLLLVKQAEGSLIPDYDLLAMVASWAIDHIKVKLFEEKHALYKILFLRELFSNVLNGMRDDIRGLELILTDAFMVIKLFFTRFTSHMLHEQHIFSRTRLSREVLIQFSCFTKWIPQPVLVSFDRLQPDLFS